MGYPIRQSFDVGASSSNYCTNSNTCLFLGSLWMNSKVIWTSECDFKFLRFHVVNHLFRLPVSKVNFNPITSSCCFSTLNQQPRFTPALHTPRLFFFSPPLSTSTAVLWLCNTRPDQQLFIASAVFFINGRRITKVQHTKFLGVVIDEKLSWDYHINYLIKKLRSISGALCRIRHLVPVELYTKIRAAPFKSHSIWYA